MTIKRGMTPRQMYMTVGTVAEPNIGRRHRDQYKIRGGLSPHLGYTLLESYTGLTPTGPWVLSMLRLGTSCPTTLLYCAMFIFVVVLVPTELLLAGTELVIVLFYCSHSPFWC